MKGLFIPDITAEMFRNCYIESIEELMAEGEIYDIEYEPEPQWIPVSERLPEEDNCLGGSGRQFSENVLVSVVNRDDEDEDEWVYISQTIDGEWTLELPTYCKVVAWMPLPSPYQPEEESE